MNKVTAAYRKYIPSELRDRVYDVFLGRILFFFRNYNKVIKVKFIYYFSFLLPRTDKNRLYAFLGKNGIDAIPYGFTQEYKQMKIDCFWDESKNLYYVYHLDKKLYFPCLGKEKNIVTIYKQLLKEQDIRSPHNYVEDINRLKGKVLLDIGAAEGIFALTCIDIVKEIYLFECDSQWIDALYATFAPWKEKVTIIQKRIGDTNDEKMATIDRIVSENSLSNLFLKMDIEGGERLALRGADRTLRVEAGQIDYAICTYHKENDAQEINDTLSSCGFQSEFTDGYIYYENKMRKAILRKVIM
jgi:hypothetical protein